MSTAFYDYVYIKVGQGIVLTVDNVPVKEHITYQKYLDSMGEKGYELVSARKIGFSGHMLTLIRRRHQPKTFWYYRYLEVDRGVVKRYDEPVGMTWERYLAHQAHAEWVLAAELPSNRVGRFWPILKKSEVAE